MKFLRVLWRAVAAIVLIVWHIALPVFNAVFREIKLPSALRWRWLWANRTLRLLGVKVEVQTPIPTVKPAMFIGNHRSYLDPVVTLKDIEALPVAKAEVASWPLIGFGTKATGVMYVERDSKSSRGATISAMAKCIHDGYSVLVYPEGTTHTNPVTIEFRWGAFVLAAKEGFPVVPMAIDYLDLQDAWIGDDAFLGHFVRCFSKKETHIKIRYGQPLYSDDPSVLLEKAQAWINDNMLEIRAEFEGHKLQPQL